ncbi:hypothetical protein C8J56DRAFT_891484 [Mycena floridula]|nr:hypothetical protein C8J56DRAFT_891484 [Mycena floridula]
MTMSHRGLSNNHGLQEPDLHYVNDLYPNPAEYDEQVLFGGFEENGQWSQQFAQRSVAQANRQGFGYGHPRVLSRAPGQAEVVRPGYQYSLQMYSHAGQFQVPSSEPFSSPQPSITEASLNVLLQAVIINSRKQDQIIARQDAAEKVAEGLKNQLQSLQVPLKTVKNDFRRICGIGKSQRWLTCSEDGARHLNGITDEEYLAPDFNKLVSSPYNESFISAIANKTMESLNNEDYFAKYIRNPDYFWDTTTLETLAKRTFSGFKCEYDVSNNPFKQEKKLYKWDLSSLMKVDHMSDEASGPESESEMSKEEWESGMAKITEIPGTSVSNLKLANFSFLEVIDPIWRSDAVRSALSQYPLC